MRIEKIEKYLFVRYDDGKLIPMPITEETLTTIKTELISERKKWLKMYDDYRAISEVTPLDFLRIRMYMKASEALERKLKADVDIQQVDLLLKEIERANRRARCSA